MRPAHQTPRPRPTLRIMLHAVFDVAGMLMFATGAMWLACRQALFIPDFPVNMTEAIVVSVGGLLMMLWAASRILREMITRR
ncbi:MAG: hypothetical protein IPI21_15465 [Propionivibrio sp.]|nr:hypothetical protein [Propionivibrio sp.]